MEPLKTIALAVAAAAAASLAAFSAHAIAAPPAPDIKVTVAPPGKPLTPGARSEAVVTLQVPEGVHLNKYPGIRFTFEPTSALAFDQETLRFGLAEMPEDIDTNTYETIDPMKVKFRVSDKAHPGSTAVKGKVKYFYCVKKSGFCAPGTRDLAFSVPIAAAR